VKSDLVKIASLMFWHECHQVAVWTFRAFAYLLIAHLFFNIFQAVGSPQAQLIYLAATELTTMGVRKITLDIERQIQQKNWNPFFILPFSFFDREMARGLGSTLWNAFVLNVALLLSLAVSKVIGYITIAGFVFYLLCSILGMYILLLTNFFIGILAYWIRNVRSIMYMNISAVFFFGGLIIPIDQYPVVLKKIVFCTPYPWILWFPASTLAYGTTDVVFKLGIAMLWIILLQFLCVKTLARMMRSVQLNG
jgi:ABC-2 type transport system permease protein